ncbi:protein SCO1/2 [Modicisalibacter ilicicola DSM 19980]|uniref:Protein SCO1/2 n=1 Tax=Modicisalibacter ilicicola DSM 19980 TaxID=1121942 RepID=A0A1M5CJ32_9GAMM|nr:SCO family protein [Halomonas ilicicola]SHF54587.1 protein SCO1/2 [Halomonas ilicicola DSM 19980]
MNWKASLGLTVAGMLWLAMPAWGQTPAQQEAILDRVDYEQRIGNRLPGALRFRDANGELVDIASLTAGKPTVLGLAWYNCPMLCPMLLDRLADTTQTLPFDQDDYRVVIVSIAPDEGPEDADRLGRELRNRHGGVIDNWHFLSGKKPAIDALAEAAGFRYAYDPESGNYAHPAGVVVASGGGRITHYLLGMRPQAPDLKLALVESSTGELGSPLQKVLVRCYRFDPATGQYTLAVTRLLQVAGVTTVLLMLLAVLWMRRRQVA